MSSTYSTALEETALLPPVSSEETQRMTYPKARCPECGKKYKIFAEGGAPGREIVKRCIGCERGTNGLKRSGCWSKLASYFASLF